MGYLMKRPDPRLLRAEKLLTEAVRLVAEIKAGVPAPRRRRKRRRQFRAPAILQALREGASLDAAKGARDPRLPSKRTIAKYRKTDPAFNREASAILRERSREGGRRKRSAPNPGATTWAAHLPGPFHDWNAIAAKIEAGASVGPYTKNRQGLPCHTLIMKRRKADPVFAKRVAAALAGRFGEGRRGTTRHPFDREAVLERIRRGAVIKACPPEPGMPWKHRIDLQRKADPSFNEAVQAACLEARRRRVNRNALAKAGKDAAWRAANEAVPKTIDPDLRGDVVGDLALQLMEGIVALKDDLQRAWRACRTRLNRDRWKEVSLDAPISGTDGLRRIDLLVAEAGQ
jgi:hypothetical protein